MHKKNSLSFQKKIFLKKEADKMFIRNIFLYKNKNYKNEKLSKLILNFYKGNNAKKNTNSILEIGCGDGSRLEYLSTQLKKKFYGLDPSKKSIFKARKKGIIARIGTADILPYKNKFFEMVIFGFCLYLVDDEDLFKIITETDRVLNDKGVVVIYDFISKNPKYYNYKHYKNIFSRHMDYKKFFMTHPSYKLILEKKFLYHKNMVNSHTNVSISFIIKNEKNFK